MIYVPNSYSRSASSGIVSITENKFYLIFLTAFRHDSNINNISSDFNDNNNRIYTKYMKFCKILQYV